MSKALVAVFLMICLAFAGCAKKGTPKEVAPDDWRGKIMEQAKVDLDDKKLLFRFCFDPIPCKAESANALLGSYEGMCGIAWIDRRNPHDAYLSHEPYLYVLDQNNELLLLTPDVHLWGTTPRVNMFRCPAKPERIR